MRPGTIEGRTHVLCAPKNWDEARDGICSGLPVRVEQDQTGVHMTSAWFPDPGELEALQAGAPLYLRIFTTAHPVVAVFAGAAPE